jgi:hypothetical protein
VIGASLPIAPSFIQMDSEIKQKEIIDRIIRLEDPISTLHEDVHFVSGCIYDKIKSGNRLKMDFEGSFYKRYSKPLFSLEAARYIRIFSAPGKPFVRGFTVVDSYYIVSYLCVFFEDSDKFTALLEKMDNSTCGDVFTSDQTANELGLPEPVVDAVFEIYDKKGWGVYSQSNVRGTYYGKVLADD